jgi:thiamine biosynthesis lipoprotein
MNTVFEVFVSHPDAQYVAQASQAAFSLVDRLEDELSRFRPNSDITRINHLRRGERTRVGVAAFECLLIAQHLFVLTGGAFDVTIGTGLASLVLDADDSTVTADADGVRVDLGGIGKGYAVDLMADVLEEWGLQRAMVHGGFSSVLAIEPPEGQDGWPLTLSDPGDASHVLVRRSMRQMALSASGVRKGDHIVDPRTGAAARERKAAWAALARPATAAGPHEGPRIAPAAVADALTTAAMLLDVEKLEQLCAASPGLELWVLPEAGELLHLGG